MRYLGKKKISTRVKRHQQCSICHPEVKGGRAFEKRNWKKEGESDVRQGLEDNRE